MMFKAITEVVNNKELLSTWIEASYIFQNTPSLTTLTSTMVKFQRSYAELWKLQVSPVVETLNRLSSELSRLNLNWGHILRNEPHEIWLSSINTVGNFDLWASKNDADMNFLKSEGDEGSILIASQVSYDGRSVGMLKVWTSE
jgi:hypothetical protein